MERDYRITGKWREQSDVVKAPLGFEGKLHRALLSKREELANPNYSQQSVEGVLDSIFCARVLH